MGRGKEKGEKGGRGDLITDNLIHRGAPLLKAPTKKRFELPTYGHFKKVYFYGSKICTFKNNLMPLI